MRLYTCKRPPEGGEELFVGAAREGCVYPLSAFGLSFPDMTALVRGITAEQLEALGNPPADAEAVPLSSLKVCAPIPHPAQDVLCLGINYRAHQEEAGRFSQDAFGDRPRAIYFSKRVNTAPGDGDPIPRYKGLVDSLDYENELGVILGKDAWQVREEDAVRYIFGYTIINDVSARNLQTGHKQWYFGKSLDGYTPMGPCIVTADEIAYPPQLAVRTRVNGELRQDGNTRDFITNIAQVIAELSQGMTLQAGTIIATGTPAGVGMGMQPPCFLETGDVVVCEIEGIGTLTNAVG